MGRPPGSPNRAGGQKPGRKPGSSQRPHLKDAEIIDAKIKVLALLENGAAKHLTECADILGLSRTQMYFWKQSDTQWAKEIELTDQITADRLEKEIEQAIVEGKAISMPYVTARIFRLKALRPEKYKENYKFEVTDANMKQLLTDLRNLGKSEPKKEAEKPSEAPQKDSLPALSELPEE